MSVTEIYNFIKADGNIMETKTLIKQPKITLYVSIAYIILVKWLVPRIMENRKPLEMRRTIVLYNLLVCLLNGILAYMAIAMTSESWNGRCEIKAMPNNFIQRGWHVMWYVWMVKYLELLDTVFFALRKKDNQITFLHVFHHCAMVLVFAHGMNLKATAFYFMFGIAINLSIHVVMYLYYGLAAIGPHMQKYLWWKKYLTLIQITQFLIVLSYAAYGFVTGCEEYGKSELFIFVSVAIILVLFINFYIKSYHAKPHFNKRLT